MKYVAVEYAKDRWRVERQRSQPSHSDSTASDVVCTVNGTPAAEREIFRSSQENAKQIAALLNKVCGYYDRIRREFVLGFDHTIVAGKQRAMLSHVLRLPFKGRKLVIRGEEAKNFRLLKVLVNGEPQAFVAPEGQPALDFHEFAAAAGKNSALEEVGAGSVIALVVENVTDKPKSFLAAYLGTEYDVSR